MTIHRRAFDGLIPGALPPIGGIGGIGVAIAAAALLCAPTGLTAQSHTPGEPHEPHMLAAADFGIDPSAVTFTKDIAPNPGAELRAVPPRGRGGPHLTPKLLLWKPLRFQFTQN